MSPFENASVYPAAVAFIVLLCCLFLAVRHINEELASDYKPRPFQVAPPSTKAKTIFVLLIAFIILVIVFAGIAIYKHSNP